MTNWFLVWFQWFILCFQDQNQDNSLNSTQKIGDINENVQENDPSDKYAYFSSPHKHDKEETSKNADVSSIIKNMTNIMSTTITKSETKDSVKVDDIETVQRVKNSQSSTSEEDQIGAQKQINGSERSHEGKRIAPPKNVQPLIGGMNLIRASNYGQRVLQKWVFG